MNKARAARHKPFTNQIQKGVATGRQDKSTMTEPEAIDQAHQIIPRLRTTRTAPMTAMSKAFRAIAIWLHYWAIRPGLSS